MANHKMALDYQRGVLIQKLGKLVEIPEYIHLAIKLFATECSLKKCEDSNASKSEFRALLDEYLRTFDQGGRMIVAGAIRDKDGIYKVDFEVLSEGEIREVT